MRQSTIFLSSATALAIVCIVAIVAPESSCRSREQSSVQGLALIPQTGSGAVQGK
jgi:hypothetical protein